MDTVRVLCKGEFRHITTWISLCMAIGLQCVRLDLRATTSFFYSFPGLPPLLGLGCHWVSFPHSCTGALRSMTINE